MRLISWKVKSFEPTAQMYWCLTLADLGLFEFSVTWGGVDSTPPSKIAKNHAKDKKTWEIMENHQNRGNNLKNPEKIRFSRFYTDFTPILPRFSENSDKFSKFHNFWTTYRKNMYDHSN